MQDYKKCLLTKKLSESFRLELIFIIKIENFWQNPNKYHSKPWEVLAKPEIFDVIIRIYNFIEHTGQNTTAKNTIWIYYGIIHKEIFTIEKLLINPKTLSSQLIILTKLFKKVLIDLIDIKQLSTLHSTIYCIAHDGWNNPPPPSNSFFF